MSKTPEDVDVIGEELVEVGNAEVECAALVDFLRDKGNIPGKDLSVHITPEMEKEATTLHLLPLSRWDAYALISALAKTDAQTIQRMSEGKQCMCPRCKMIFGQHKILVKRISESIPFPEHLPPADGEVSSAQAEANTHRAKGTLN